MRAGHPHQTIADLPIDILKRILAFVNGIERLEIRAQFGMVNRSFAAAVRQMPSVTMSRQNFVAGVTGTELVLSAAAQECLSATLAHVTKLELSSVHSSSWSCMFRVIRCCPELRKLQMHLQPELGHPLIEKSLFQHLWQLFNRDSTVLNHLQEVEIRSRDGIILQAASTDKVLWRQEALASISAGDLTILRGLTSCALGGRSNLHPCNEGTDHSMFRLMPALGTINAGANPLHTPFHGTVLGKLTTATAGTFRQARVVHCSGVLGRVFNMTAIEGIDSIKSWVSVGHQVNHLLDKIAPELETMSVRVHWPPNARPVLKSYKVFLTPHLRHVDITLCVPGSTLHLHGLPHCDITLLRVASSRVSIEQHLWDWLLATFHFRLTGMTTYTSAFLDDEPVSHVLLHSNDIAEPVMLDFQRS